jgi:hypothetical protein
MKVWRKNIHGRPSLVHLLKMSEATYFRSQILTVCTRLQLLAQAKWEMESRMFLRSRAIRSI